MIVSFNTTGPMPPLYFVHGAVGLMPLGQYLAANLGKDQPLHILHAEGMDGRPCDEKSIPRDVLEMAALYSDQIEGTAPNGPILIGGMCKGALVAIEVAHELNRRGRDTGPVILADPPEQPGRSISPGFRKNLDDPKFMAHLAERVRAQLELHASLPYNTMPFEIGDAGSLNAAVQAGINCMSVLDIHIPRPYPGDVMAIVSPQRVRGFFEPQRYWMTSLGTLRLAQVVPCNHIELFQSSRHEFARAMRYLLSIAFLENPAADDVGRRADFHTFGGLDEFEGARPEGAMAQLFLRKAQSFFRK